MQRGAHLHWPPLLFPWLADNLTPEKCLFSAHHLNCISDDHDIMSCCFFIGTTANEIHLKRREIAENKWPNWKEALTMSKFKVLNVKYEWRLYNFLANEALGVFFQFSLTSFGHLLPLLLSQIFLLRSRFKLTCGDNFLIWPHVTLIFSCLLFHPQFDIVWDVVSELSLWCERNIAYFHNRLKCNWDDEEEFSKKNASHC